MTDEQLHFDEHGERQRERLEQQLEDKLDHELDVAEKSDLAGRIGTNAGIQNSARQDAARKKREKDAQDSREAIFIAMLNDVYDYGQAEIDAANVQMSAHDILQDMHDKGELDPNNPDHAKIFKDAGLDPDDYRARGQDALDDNKTRINARRDRGYQIQDDVRRARGGDMDAAARVEDIAREQGIEVAAEQTLAMATGNEVYTADEQVDSIVTQIEDDELKSEIYEQNGYADDEAERSVFMGTEDSLERGDMTSSGDGLESLFASPNPISSPFSPTAEFNAASSMDIFGADEPEAAVANHSVGIDAGPSSDTAGNIFATPPTR